MKRKVDTTREFRAPAQAAASPPGSPGRSESGKSDAAVEDSVHATPPRPPHERIQVRAYEIYLARNGGGGGGGGAGEALSDWLRAEREVGAAQR